MTQNQTFITQRDVQVSVILSGAKDHDFRFFPRFLRKQRGKNDDDRKKLAHGVNCFISKRQRLVLFRTVAFFVLWFFSFLEIFPASLISSKAYAQTILDLPVPGSMVSITPKFIPASLRGIKIDPDNPLQFDFIISPGDSGLAGEALKREAQRLIDYFLTSLTVPEDEIWVNLSPYENSRIVAKSLGVTEMGRDLLAQDYILKNLAASLTSPEEKLGAKFWQRVYQKIQVVYGKTAIPVNTFNKIWIVPQKARIYEGKDMVYIVEGHLKVMLEQDYLALKENRFNKKLGMDRLKTQETKELNDLSSQITKEIILPEIEKEVNDGKNFAVLRQIFSALILATWFKRNFKKSLLGEVYFDQNRIAGIDLEDKKVKDKIYQQYCEAFRVGVYNFIKEDYDAQTQQTIPRKYFSGGFGSVKELELVRVDSAALSSEELAQTPVLLVRSELKTYSDQQTKIDPLIEEAFKDKEKNVVEINDLADPVVQRFLNYLEFLQGHFEKQDSSIQGVIDTFKRLVKKDLPAAEGKTVPQLDLLLMARAPFAEHASDRGAHIVVKSREVWEKNPAEFVKILAHVYTAFLGQHHAVSVAVEMAADLWVNYPGISFEELIVRLKSKEKEFRERIIEVGYPDWNLGVVGEF